MLCAVVPRPSTKSSWHVSVFTLMYLQAHQLDTDFYDTYFTPGAYLKTHAEYRRNWA